MTPQRLEAILQGFRKLNVLVVGDICLDRWCEYDPALAEPSRETGIPRLAVTKTECTPGAGGTIANNVAALCVKRTAVLGVWGEDGFGWELGVALQARGIEHEASLRSAEVCTFTYTKLLNSKNGEEDRPRVDFINTRPLPAAIEARLTDRLRQLAPEFDVLLVSDQAETSAGGVVTGAVRDELKRLAIENPQKVLWVDSRLRAEHFRNIIVKPNEDEAKAACLRAFGEVSYARMRECLQAPLVVVTHGSRGALLVEPCGESWVETKPVPKPVDICGAGDSFSAGAACAFALTRNAREAAEMGNLVASVTIMKKGTGTASPDELRKAL